jgi:polyisoprenoid-binding protein YceI
VRRALAGSWEELFHLLGDGRFLVRPAALPGERHYPEIRYESSRIEALGGPNFRILGDLTLRGVTMTAELEATVEGAERDPWGNERVGIRVRGRIDRKEFGVSWQKMLESGRFLVGDEVSVLVGVSAVKAA